MYYPTWCADMLKMSPEDLFVALQSIRVADRSSEWMKYRGHLLRRSKWLFVNNLVERVTVYLYPGFQYESIVQEYSLVGDSPIVQRIAELISPDVNHVIGTLYKVRIIQRLAAFLFSFMHVLIRMCFDACNLHCLLCASFLSIA